MGRRLDFLMELQRHEGKPYVWNADGPDFFDCSGLVAYSLLQVGGPDWRATHNAHAMWNQLEPTDAPKPGDLAFYGSPERVNHVMVVVGDGRVFGACGGNRYTTSADVARQKAASVKFRPRVDYRLDFRGYRSLAPFLDKE